MYSTPHCSNVPSTGSTEFYSYLVAAQNFSAKLQDVLHFTGHYVAYRDANGDERQLSNNIGTEIFSMTCTAEYEGALACEQDTFYKGSEGVLAGTTLSKNSSFLYVKDGDDYESKCAELKLKL